MAENRRKQQKSMSLSLTSETAVEYGYHSKGLLARIGQSAIRVSTVKEPHTYMKAVGTNELKRILAEEFNIQ